MQMNFIRIFIYVFDWFFTYIIKGRPERRERDRLSEKQFSRVITSLRFTRGKSEAVISIPRAPSHRRRVGCSKLGVFVHRIGRELIASYFAAVFAGQLRKLIRNDYKIWFCRRMHMRCSGFRLFRDRGAELRSESIVVK